ncbi:U32 family peptidase [Sutterella sp.]|uniref:peptidase U32 family protein n=1 Tax=Sutterella sp. TaxID=1981025 RepID=UPI0026E0863E|nr:DUF3656 domain-containing protein [Sutterella sp.]MDO5530886.1 DUF3656 domain-containing protein [Sutterella sp.]
MTFVTSAPARTALELLAPARDADTGIAAIDHGADAVYIGGPAFGARAAAGNTLDDIARLTEYAHRYRARVFVALNTLLTDAELSPARKLAFDVAAAGADALIVQDMGLLMGELPEIELHASTQCDIRTPAKARFLEAAGFSQVVLARELSLEEIAAARAALTHARIEFFIHGALCVSYSGQCWMSEAVTRRSANRGECSQLCRLPYDVETLSGEKLLKRKHVLSLKDNDQTANLEALIDAGVSSFKIEGRLKGLAYVKNVTAHYRARIDEILARRPELSRSSEGESSLTFTPSTEKVFNRGQTEYFIHGRAFDRPYELAELESPKHAGEPAATVERIDGDRVIVRALPGVGFANGDGLTYLAADEEIHGLAVNRAEPLPARRGGEENLWALYPSEPASRLPGLARGLTLRRNRDHAFMKLMAGRTAERRIPVDLIFTTHEDGLDLVVTDGESVGSASVALDLQEPSDPEKNRASLAVNLGKLGDTPFSARNVFIPENLDVFVPASFANQLRRAAVEELLEAREAARVKPRRAPADPSAESPDRILDFRANVANRAARDFWEAHGATVTQPAFEIKPVAHAPLMNCRHCVRASMKLCPKMLKAFPGILETVDRAMLRPEPLILVNSAGERFRAEFHCKASPCGMTIEPEGEFVRAKPRVERDGDAARPARAEHRRRENAPERGRRPEEDRGARKQDRLQGKQQSQALCESGRLKHNKGMGAPRPRAAASNNRRGRERR